MSTEFLRVVVGLASGATERFDGIGLVDGLDRKIRGAAVELRAGGDTVYELTVTPLDVTDPVTSISYEVFTPIANLRQVVVPDSGRWFMNSLQPTSAWRFQRHLESTVADVLTPLYVLCGPDGLTEAAFGLIGPPYEMSFEVLQPASNRALNVHVGWIGLAFRRGYRGHPIPARARGADGSVTEHLYAWRRDGARGGGLTWTDTLRHFATQQRIRHGLQDLVSDRAFAPTWCSWVAWSSDDLSEDLILRNVRRGVDLGVTTFIIDDGWFGPGLDSSYDTPLNVGDWTPDPAKLPDLPGLVGKIRDLGGRTVLWCAPHAVGPVARCLPERAHLLMRDAGGDPAVSETQFLSMCFRSPEAREVMAEICVGLIRRYDCDGAKYDLFNWLPKAGCQSDRHTHDTESMLHGLLLTLERIDTETRAVKPDYLVELKQNYGTPFFSAVGSMMRAGDGPYAPQNNFLRTLHVQTYTRAALNDYQTFAPGDTPDDVAVAVLLMMAAGIPAYGVDLGALGEEAAQVLRHYHAWYADRRLMDGRTALDAEHRLVRAADDVLFVVQEAVPVPWDGREMTVLNGTYSDHLVLRGRSETARRAVSLDGGGRTRHLTLLEPGRACWAIPVPPGGSVTITDIEEQADGTAATNPA